MKNAVLWDIETSSHLTANTMHLCYVNDEIFTAVSMKNAVFWGVMPWVPFNNRRFVGIYHLRQQSERNQRARNNVRSC
jgi:hypothetical protein